MKKWKQPADTGNNHSSDEPSKNTHRWSLFAVVPKFADVVRGDKFHRHRNLLQEITFAPDIFVSKLRRFPCHGFRKLHSGGGNFALGDHLYDIVRAIES